MGIQARLHRAGQQLTMLPDPDGGSFDAAGDFDRLLPAADPTFLVLSQVDAHGDLDVTRDKMPQLISDIDRLRPLARTGPERRGLLRLRALAEQCATTPGTSLMFLGD
ncbi:hypothetical protein ACQP2F_08980 [Actinoplanes sp. CA-030573]|uniref:hypothetical protein n=1 Tax=Actinoplanes sp. CA-030573 TaxID=3239898 RepID=UPI003D8DF464